ncbi:Na+/H+ antiporter NhaC family protein [Aminipila sp.]|uniref:Na+/H+ antiporter NhaC family protein n=1 Tax=Aminipila sp. TaxID=2060095 RepID=UPI0028990941|nr:Na+/H+ antiporter NhaC family protein [Aminipila sp.]
MHANILSIVPIILTIGLAIKTRNVIVSLMAGVFSGVLIVVGGNPIAATKSMIGDYFMAQMMDSYNAGIILLLVFIGGFVTLIEKSGGAEAFARSVANFVDTRCKTQIAAWLGGILVFFSELGTPLIVGPIFTPIFRKMRISKEKLAWIIDTTASPVCVLIPFIGWGVYSMGLIQTELDALNITNITDWTAFIKAIPFQIYPILCLIMVPLVAFSKKEFGAMAKAEHNARKGIFSNLEGEDKIESKSMIIDNKVSPLVAIIPLIVLFVTLFAILIPQGFPVKQVPGSDFRIALITGYLFASIVMIGMMVYYKVKSLKEAVSTYLKGYGKLFECIIMLILAWSLSSVGKTLGTSEFIVELANGNIPAWSVPAIIFIIGAIMSFATGTSWGTFAIVMPIAIPMAVALGAPLYVTIAAVLSGGLFGDHCSPVSDTTILAATGSSCGLMEHMWTQLPYALICAGVSFVGFIAAGITDNIIVTAICIVGLFVVYTLVAKLKGEKIENLNISQIEEIDRTESPQQA